jgi:hypothetical protein
MPIRVDAPKVRPSRDTRELHGFDNLHPRGYLEAHKAIGKMNQYKSGGGISHGLQLPDIERGQVLKKPGSITPQTKLNAETYKLGPRARDSGRLDDLL